MTKHSPQFRRALSSIARGDLMIAPIKSYLYDPNFPEFEVKVGGLGARTPDYHFHPSEHPGWNERSLYLWMTRPDLIAAEPMDPTGVLSMTAGSIWHSIIGHIVTELGLVTALEVPVEDPARRTRGKMDGVMVGGNEIFELKGLALDTPLPTPTGWTTMRDVQVGDELIGSDGRPCTVTDVSGVSWKRCYRLSFDDGTSVVADEEHRWYTHAGQAGRLRPGIRTTAEICNSLFCTGRQANHRILNAMPLDLPDHDLPLDPYMLGVWIGDGSKHNGAVTQRSQSSLWGVLAERGFEVGDEWGGGRGGHGTRTIYGLRSTLIEMDLLGNRKAIPVAYLRGSYEQRLSLLRGLMDTDGTWSPLRGQATFTSIDEDLARQVRELVLSLGMRCRIQRVTARGFGVERDAFHVVFSPTVNPFAARHELLGDYVAPARAHRRSISSVEFVGVLQTKCVMVDSHDHTYLCGSQMVPTHNTMKEGRLRMMEDSAKYIELNPSYHLQANEYMRMSGIHRERVLVMSLTFPYEMKEFVIEYDHRLGQQTAEKYERVLQAVADARPPMCDGCSAKEKKGCPARFVCASEMAA